MSNIATYLEQAVQDWAFNNTTMPSSPANVFLALHSADPTNDGTANEIDAADYSRVSTDSTDWNREAGNNPSTVTNTSELTFGEATSNWGTVSHVTIQDAATGGNALWQGELELSKTIENGDELIFRVGDITIDLS